MAKSKRGRFRYTIDVEKSTGDFGVWNFESFDNRGAALSYAEKMAQSHPDMRVTVRVRALNPAKNILKIA